MTGARLSHFTEDKKAKVLTLRAEGLSYAVIAERMGMKRKTVSEWCRKAKKKRLRTV